MTVQRTREILRRLACIGGYIVLYLGWRDVCAKSEDGGIGKTFREMLIIIVIYSTNNNNYGIIIGII